MTCPSSCCPTSGLLPNLCPTSAQPRASGAVALPNLPNLPRTHAYRAWPARLPLCIYAYRLGRYGRLGSASNGAGLKLPDLCHTFRRYGIADPWVGRAAERDSRLTIHGAARGSVETSHDPRRSPVKHGSSLGGGVVRAARPQNPHRFSVPFLVPGCWVGST